jgi:hypothetical protein
VSRFASETSLRSSGDGGVGGEGSSDGDGGRTSAFCVDIANVDTALMSEEDGVALACPDYVGILCEENGKEGFDDEIIFRVLNPVMKGHMQGKWNSMRHEYKHRRNARHSSMVPNNPGYPHRCSLLLDPRRV